MILWWWPIFNFIHVVIIRDFPPLKWHNNNIIIKRLNWMDNTEMVIYNKINGNIYGKVSSRDKIDDWPHARPTNEGTNQPSQRDDRGSKKNPCGQIDHSKYHHKSHQGLSGQSFGRSVSDAKTLSDVHVARELWYLLRYLAQWGEKKSPSSIVRILWFVCRIAADRSFGGRTHSLIRSSSLLASGHWQPAPFAGVWFRVCNKRSYFDPFKGLSQF